jgi:O-antigen/teichoic acid export membrane protein
MRTGPRVLFNAVTKWVATCVEGLSGFILIPILLSELGQDGYGLTALLLALVGLGMILDLGLRSATSKLLADQIALGNQVRFNELASTTLAAYLFLGVLGSLSCIALAEPLADWLKAPDRLRAEAVFLVRWYGAGAIFLQVVRPMVAAVLESRNRFDLVNGVMTVGKVLELGGVLIAVRYMGAGIYGWAGVTFTVMVASLLALVVLAWRTAPEVRLRFRYVSLSTLFCTLKLSGQVFLLQLNQLISIHSDPFVLSKFLGPSALAVYTPPTKLKIFATNFAGVLSSQLHPLAAGASATGNLADLRAVLYRGTRYTFLMGIPIAVFFGVFSGPIARIWLGKALGDGVHTAAMVLLCWSVVNLFVYAAGSQWPVLLGTQRLRFVVIFRTATGALNLIASIILVGYTSLGVIGALLPTVAIEAIRWPIFSAYTSRVCGVSLREYVRHSHMRPMIVMGSLLALAGALRVFFAIDSLGALLLCFTVLGLAWGVLTWVIGFTLQDRQQFARLALKGWRSIKVGLKVSSDD